MALPSPPRSRRNIHVRGLQPTDPSKHEVGVPWLFKSLTLMSQREVLTAVRWHTDASLVLIYSPIRLWIYARPVGKPIASDRNSRTGVAGNRIARFQPQECLRPM